MAMNVTEAIIGAPGAFMQCFALAAVLVSRNPEVIIVNLNDRLKALTAANSKKPWFFFGRLGSYFRLRLSRDIGGIDSASGFRDASCARDATGAEAHPASVHELGVSRMTAQAASHVYFGLNPMWVSTCVLAITYATIMSEKVNRSIVALVGAGVMVLVGVLDQDEAIKGIDWNTIGLLTGMMILVSISRRSGMFQYLAIWSAKAAKAHPTGILFILQITTAVLSAFLDNVTTVLLIVPVTLAICNTLKVPAYPYLFAEIFASNIGGTATLIGDPPNILIGSQVGLTFNDFVFHLTPVIVIVMMVQAVINPPCDRIPAGRYDLIRHEQR